MKPLPHDHGNISENVRRKVPKEEDFIMVSELFRILGDATRLKIFWLLCHGEECVINLSSILDMSSPAVSHHIRQLKSAGLIIGRRSGKEVYYTASSSNAAQHLHKDIESLIEIVCPDIFK